jgi:hypothetical protein
MIDFDPTTPQPDAGDVTPPHGDEVLNREPRDRDSQPPISPDLVDELPDD